MGKPYAALRLSAALLAAIAAPARPASSSPGQHEWVRAAEAASQQSEAQHRPCGGPGQGARVEVDIPDPMDGTTS